MIRREVFDEIAFLDDRHGEPEWHYFDEDFRYAEDVECWTRMACTTEFGFGGVPETLTDYRVISGSLSSGTHDHYEHWERHFQKVVDYAPDVAAAHGAAARAYQLRFYARRELQAGDPVEGLRWLARAVRSYPRIFLEEPARSFVTTAALIVAAVLPKRLVEAAVTRGMKFTGYAGTNGANHQGEEH